MKQIKKILSVFLVMMIAITSMVKVNALTYSGYIKGHDYLSPRYYYMHVKGSREMWVTFRFITRSTDGAFMYCVQPFVSIDADAKYNITTEDIPSVMGISESTWKQISRIAYYGYMYTDSSHDHTASKWYAATQMLIWNTVDPSVDSFFTKTLRGTRDDSILRTEQNEIMELANKHLTKPSFADMPSEMIIGNSITITDTKGVLSTYEIANVKGGTVTKNGNTLTITPTEVGTLTFDIQKLGNKYGEPVSLYYVDGSQNVIRRGDIDPITIKNSIEVYGGKVTPNKTDADTLTNEPQGEATLEGAIYGIYKEDGTKVGTVSTNSEGKGTSDYLPSLGNFYLLEETPSKGYQLDKNKYYFEITLDNLYPEIQVFEKVINLDFDFTKVYASDTTGIMTPEVGIEFGIYNNKDEEVRHLITDSQGNFKFNLPYGTYTVKQLTTTKGHEKMEDFTIEVKETGPVVKKTIANAEIKAKLRVVKIDKETGKVIKRSNITFKIFSVDKNEYVCQTTSYPDQEQYCEFKTNKDGEFITPFVLNSGTYKLEEVDQVIDGYLWNKESHEFTIDENSTLRTDSEYGVIFDTKFENQRVKGEVKIEKIGHNIEIQDEGLILFEEPLEGIKFCIYNKNDKEIECGTTNSDGILTFKNLELGDYYIKEIETLDGYILDETKHELSLKYKDQYTAIIKYETIIDNYVPTGTLEFTKTDFSESKTLPNTTIEIYSENDILIFTGKTDENGKIVIDKLPIGKYYIIEKEAPEGYKLNPNKMKFEIKENGEIVKSTMKDELIIEVPNTELNDYHIPEVIGISLMLLGIGVLIYEEKRKK